MKEGLSEELSSRGIGAALLMVARRDKTTIMSNRSGELLLFMMILGFVRDWSFIQNQLVPRALTKWREVCHPLSTT